jgi:hypothetical protein
MISALYIGENVSNSKIESKSGSKLLASSYDPLKKLKNARGRLASLGDHDKHYCSG